MNTSVRSLADTSLTGSNAPLSSIRLRRASTGVARYSGRGTRKTLRENCKDKGSFLFFFWLQASNSKISSSVHNKRRKNALIFF